MKAVGHSVEVLCTLMWIGLVVRPDARSWAPRKFYICGESGGISCLSI